MAMSTKQGDYLLTELIAIRAHVAEIVPGGRDPEASYMGKRDAIRGLDRLIGDDTRGLSRVRCGRSLR